MNAYLILVLVGMIFAHILAEYCMQGMMATMKSKAFWKEMFVGRMPSMRCMSTETEDDETRRVALSFEKALRDEHDKAEEAWESHPCRHDYIPAMIGHSFIWAVMISIAPIVWLIVRGYDTWWLMTIMMVANTALHAVIDNIRTNVGRMTMIEAHLWYMGQIIVTFVVCVIITIVG